MKPSNADSAIVASKWSHFEPDSTRSYFGFAPLRAYLIETAYGPALAEKHKDNRFWAEDILVSTMLRGRRIKNVLSLCCGFGEVERRIVSRLPSVETCLGVDLAAGALEEARAQAVAQGLTGFTYECADLNYYAWPEAAFNLIIANGALHHLTSLEQVVEGIARALRPGGMLYANEHVGANRLNHPARQLELINAASYLVPPEMRRRSPLPFDDPRPFPQMVNRLYVRSAAAPQPPPGLRAKARTALARAVFSAGAFHFGALYRSPAAKLARSDPSESVRSADILRLLQSQFPNTHVRPYGGGILAYALDEQFFDAYDEANPQHRAVLHLLCSLERELMASGELGPEHAILTATKVADRKAPAERRSKSPTRGTTRGPAQRSSRRSGRTRSRR
jgi:SAM-dependent methyltransferase